MGKQALVEFLFFLSFGSGYDTHALFEMLTSRELWSKACFGQRHSSLLVVILPGLVLLGIHMHLFKVS